MLDKQAINKWIIEVVTEVVTQEQKAAGPDAIIKEMIKTCVPSLTRVFVKVVSHLSICEEIPETWTEGFINVSYKKGAYLIHIIIEV